MRGGPLEGIDLILHCRARRVNNRTILAEGRAGKHHSGTWQFPVIRPCLQRPVSASPMQMAVGVDASRDAANESGLRAMEAR